MHVIILWYIILCYVILYYMSSFCSGTRSLVRPLSRPCRRRQARLRRVYMLDVHIYIYIYMFIIYSLSDIYVYVYIYIYIYVLIHGRFPKYHRVFWGRDPGTLKSNIVSIKTSTINLFGFETLKLKIPRLKLWKQTVSVADLRKFGKRRCMYRTCTHTWLD